MSNRGDEYDGERGEARSSKPRLSRRRRPDPDDGGNPFDYPGGGGGRRRPEATPCKTPSSGKTADEKRRNPPLKLKEYSGSTSIETFFQQFRTCAAYYRWTDEDKGVYLRCQLTGDAANLLWAQPDADEIGYVKRASAEGQIRICESRGKVADGAKGPSSGKRRVTSSASCGCYKSDGLGLSQGRHTLESTNRKRLFLDSVGRSAARNKDQGTRTTRHSCGIEDRNQAGNLEEGQQLVGDGSSGGTEGCC